jgi:hypothetical protein
MLSTYIQGQGESALNNLFKGYAEFLYLFRTPILPFCVGFSWVLQGFVDVHVQVQVTVQNPEPEFLNL